MTFWLRLGLGYAWEVIGEFLNILDIAVIVTLILDSGNFNNFR